MNKKLAVIVLTWNDWKNTIEWCDTLHERAPHSRFYGYKAVAFAHLGELDHAQKNLKIFQSKRPEIKKLSDYEKVAPTIIKDTLLQGLEMAGLPH